MNIFDQAIGWKRLFYGLFILNLVGILSLIVFAFWPVSKTETPQVAEFEEEASSDFVVRTTKSNLNDLVNAYLAKLLRGTKHQYSISLDEDVHLLGELPVFSTTVPLSIHLDPIVQDDGNVILKQKSISIGLLQLPNKKIMEYIKKYLPMPKWVNVNPKEEEIHVLLSEMDIKSNFQVGVENFDLEANNLAFRIKIPYKSLGIEAIEP